MVNFCKTKLSSTIKAPPSGSRHSPPRAAIFCRQVAENGGKWREMSDTVTNQFLTAYSQWIRKFRKFPLGCEIPPSILINSYYSLPRVECMEGTGGEGPHVLSIEVLLSLKNLFHLTPSSLLNGLSCRVHFSEVFEGCDGGIFWNTNQNKNWKEYNEWKKLSRLKHLVGKKWPNFDQVTKFFADQYFFPTNIFSD